MTEKKELLTEYAFLSKQYSNAMVDENGELRDDTSFTKSLRERMYKIVDLVLAIEAEEE